MVLWRQFGKTYRSEATGLRVQQTVIATVSEWNPLAKFWEQAILFLAGFIAIAAAYANSTRFPIHQLGAHAQ